jgi:hypothetical protein
VIKVETLEQKEIVDNLLDMYSDYRFLYSFFGDEEYKDVLRLVECHLIQFTEARQ